MKLLQLPEAFNKTKSWGEIRKRQTARRMLSSELIVCKECGQVSVSRERHTAHLTEPRHIHHYRSADNNKTCVQQCQAQGLVFCPWLGSIEDRIRMFKTSPWTCRTTPCDYRVTLSPNWTWIWDCFGFGIGSKGTGLGTRAWQFAEK